MRILSVISLPGINALWCSEIILGNKVFRRFARTLATNLYRTVGAFSGRTGLPPTVTGWAASCGDGP